MEPMYVRIALILFALCLPVILRVVWLWVRHRQIDFAFVKPHVVISLGASAVAVAVERIGFERGISNQMFGWFLGSLTLVMLIAHLLSFRPYTNVESKRKSFPLGFSVITFFCLMVSVSLPLAILIGQDVASFDTLANDLPEDSVLLVPRFVAPVLIDGQTRYQIYSNRISLCLTSSKEVIVEFVADSNEEHQLFRRCLTNSLGEYPDFLMVSGQLTGTPEEFEKHILYRAKEAKRQFVY